MLVALISLSYLKVNTWASNKIMLDKWDYSCNQNLSYKKSFAPINLRNKIKLHLNLYIMGCPFNMYTIIGMYTEILSYSRATKICWMGNNPDGKRAFSSSLMRTIVTRNHLPFFKIFPNLVHFCPNFQIFCPFLTFFLPFLWKITCMPLLSRIHLRWPVRSSCLFVLVFWIQPIYSFVESVQKE